MAFHAPSHYKPLPPYLCSPAGVIGVTIAGVAPEKRVVSNNRSSSYTVDCDSCHEASLGRPSPPDKEELAIRGRVAGRRREEPLLVRRGREVEHHPANRKEELERPGRADPTDLRQLVIAARACHGTWRGRGRSGEGPANVEQPVDRALAGGVHLEYIVNAAPVEAQASTHPNVRVGDGRGLGPLDPSRALHDLRPVARGGPVHLGADRALIERCERGRRGRLAVRIEQHRRVRGGLAEPLVVERDPITSRARIDRDAAAGAE